MKSKAFWPVLVICIFIFSAIAVYAISDSIITLTPVKNEITTAEEASFSLEIVNNGDETATYTVYSMQIGGWNVDTFPLSDKVVELPAGESFTTTIAARPLKKFTPGIYYIPITVQSSAGDSYTESLKIYLSPEQPVEYLPTVKTTVDMVEKINPKEPVSIKLFLENKNPLNLSGLSIKIQSDMPEFAKDFVVDLGPLETKTIEFTVIPNPIQQPKEYTLFFVLQYGGETVKIVEKNIEIVTLLPDFEIDVSHEKALLKTFSAVSVYNNGNVRNTQTIKLPISFWKALFVFGEDRVESDENGRYLTWEVTLDPNETSKIDFVTNYRIIIYALLAILLFAGFYWYIQSPIALRKIAVTSKGSDNSSLSEIKITLEVKNHSDKPVKEVTITDFVPAIANLEKGLELGSLKPKEVKHTKTGTKVSWTLSELEAKEHRLINYKMKAKLNILGTFSLPRATVEFKRKRGRTGKSYSNISRISS